MGGKRVVGAFSLIFIVMIFACFYGPWDFLRVKAKLDTADAVLINNASCYVEGRVYHKEIKNDAPVYYLKDASIVMHELRLSKVSIILYPDSDIYPNKSYIKANGIIDIFDCARNEGNFDEKKYYNSLGLVCAVKSAKISEWNCPIFFRQDYCYRFQKSIEGIYLECLPGEEAGFLSSVALGDKGLLVGDLKNLFQLVGLAHVLAVSGVHISVVCMGVYKISRRLGNSFFVSGFMSSVISVIYGMMTGSSISSVRAIGMFLIFLLSQILGEVYDAITALAVMADIILISNPLYISNTGFQFSFFAILSVNIFAKPFVKQANNIIKGERQFNLDKLNIVSKKYCKITTNILEKLKTNFIFSFVLAMANLPLMTMNYYQIPTYSVLLNILVLPLIPWILGLGLCGGIVGLFSRELGANILFICHCMIYYFEMLSTWFSKLPGGTIISGYPGIEKVVVFFAVLSGIVYVLPKIIKETYQMKIIAIQMSCMIILASYFLSPKSDQFEVDVLDVGQGDGIYICTGDDVTMFIDGGSTNVSKVGKYRIIPFLKYKGSRKIDYWFVSHGDEDHISGLEEAIEADYKIENIVLYENAIITEDLLHIINEARNKNVNVIYIKSGEQIITKHCSVKCVNSNEQEDDPNARSLCLLLKNDIDRDGQPEFQGFFGGDIGIEQENMLVKNGNLNNVDLLKVSHHGSKYSSDESFLEKLAPKYCVISCGKNNRYGHPHKETIERLKRVVPNTEIYRTDNEGQVKFTYSSKKIKIKKYIEK